MMWEHGPQLEKDDTLSSLSLDTTEKKDDTRGGEFLQESRLSLPAATAPTNWKEINS